MTNFLMGCYVFDEGFPFDLWIFLKYHSLLICP
jgi:hypothetical protein